MMTTPCPAISTNSGKRWLDDWNDLSPSERNLLMANLTGVEMRYIGSCWDIFAHAHQRPPEQPQNGQSWLTWLLIGGRGAGKTRAGAEWIRAQALGLPPFATEPVARIALVGELTFECAALWIVLMHEFWTGDLQTINALIGATALLVAYWGFRFGVLGVYVSGRTREKVSAVIGQDAPGLIEKIAKSFGTKAAMKKR